MTSAFLTSRNQQRAADDPIFALNREASQRRAAGRAVINATVGALLEDDGSLAVLPSVVEALREVPAKSEAAYAPIAGVPEFLTAVSSDLLAGTSLAEQAVAVATPGGTGALRHAVSTFLDRGQAVLTPSFYWGPYATICEEHERAVQTFPMFNASGGFGVDAFESAVTRLAREQGRLLLFLNDPCHNPTGYSMTDDEWTMVARIVGEAAKQVPVAVVCDVAYKAYAREPNRAVKRLAAIADRALVLFAWSASKAFTQYGARVGALVACTADTEQRGAIQRALAYACRGTWSNCVAGGQIAIARCLTDTSLRAKVDQERERLRALLHARVAAFNHAAGSAGLRYPRYDDGFFVTVFADDARRAAESLKAHDVFVVPQTGALRVALCSVAERDVGALVSALADAVTK